jgi:hypothetical protein
MSHGRPRVELLAIRADLRVKDTEIIVYDGRRGQIIYRKEEVGQGDQVYIYMNRRCVCVHLSFLISRILIHI